MGPSTSRDLRCPVCRAHVRADADWCMLCYTDLRLPPPPVTAPPVVEPQHARGPDGAGDPVGLEHVDVDAMLAQLAIESDSGLGPLAGRLEPKGAKAIAITGGIAVVCLVLFVLMAVLGALL